MRRIVILGCGFGGFRAARELERELGGRRVQITVVSDRDDFLYTPLLPNVATAELDASHITFGLRNAFEPTTEVLIRRVESIDLAARCLRSPAGDIAFDYLLIACGSQVNWGSHPEWAPHALTLKDAGDAVRLRARIRQALNEAAQMSSIEARNRRLTFVVGGGGPTGVEIGGSLLGALKSDLISNVAPELVAAVRVILVEKGARLLPEMPTDLAQTARERLREVGMEFRLGTSVVARNDTEVGLSTGEVIRADTFLWCGGVRAHPMVAQAGFGVDAQGRVRVHRTLRAKSPAKSVAGIFAIGDAACVGEHSLQNAQVASQQAYDAAYNIIADLSGRAYREWTYRPSADLISLGREQAAAFVAGSAIDGRAARTLYRLVHTALMPGGLKKASLLKGWLLSRHRIAPPSQRQLDDEASDELSTPKKPD